MMNSMKSLPLPTNANGDRYDAVDVYELCISRVRRNTERNRLKSLSQEIKRAAAKYDDAAARAELHTIPAFYCVGEQYKRDMTLTYESRMVHKQQPGRIVYDRILNNASHRTCPLCGLGPAKTLDHHLPKSRYPVFAVLPSNLVPACDWCQGAKLEVFPTKAEEETLHPYFDNVESESWLHAMVLESTPAVFEFGVSPPAAWGSVMAARLRHHLSVFQLADLFSRNAASTLCGIRCRLQLLHEAGGGDAVRQHLREEASSWAKYRVNHWQTAFYNAAAASDWFCDGGFARE